MKYVVLDTNIYLSCAFLLMEKHDINLIKDLEGKLKEKKAILLLPEIIKLEYERKQEEIIDTLKKQIRNIKKAIKNIEFQPYFSKEKEKIMNMLETLIMEREKNKEKVNKALQTIFDSPVTKILELTPEIITMAYKRALSGIKPFNVNVENRDII
ncbi:MAG: PIN domain-containing protein, partial [Atribacterota bacterium]